MKIGLIAYHAASNFGASLQLLSTYSFFKDKGDEPVIINWVVKDLEDFYELRTPKDQKDCLLDFRKKYWKETSLCRTSKEVAEVIEHEKLDAVIIGSDAVAQNFYPFYILPKYKIGLINTPTSDRCFPNVFWGDFIPYLKKDIPVVLMSASSQDSPYKTYSDEVCEQMHEYIKRYSFCSVRDSWTQEMFKHISRGEIVPQVTPDPVFAFNINANNIIPSREEILKKFGLPEKYFVISFLRKPAVSQSWLTKFEELANEKGYECVMLPFSYKKSLGKTKYSIELPLSPLDWYSIIKYSSGYVGHNMHPIVVSLTNDVPFFSFDNYGYARVKNLITNESSSKIKHILSLGNLLEYRVSCLNRIFFAPSPEFVLGKVLSFDINKSRKFRTDYYEKYSDMMKNIVSVIEKR